MRRCRDWWRPGTACGASCRKSLVRPGAANRRARKASIAPLSNTPVGTACASVANDSMMPRWKGSRRYCSEARSARPGQRGQAAAEFAERGTQEYLGFQRGVGAVGDEEPIHLRRRNAVGQRRGDEAARRHAHVGIEPIEFEAVEGIGQREQRADFVDAAQRTAAGERQADLSARLGRGNSAFRKLGRCAGASARRAHRRAHLRRPDAALSAMVLLMRVVRAASCGSPCTQC